MGFALLTFTVIEAVVACLLCLGSGLCLVPVARDLGIPEVLYLAASGIVAGFISSRAFRNCL